MKKTIKKMIDILTKKVTYVHIYCEKWSRSLLFFMHKGAF